MAENLDFDYKVKPLDGDSVIYGSYTNSNCDTCGHYYTWAAAMDSAGVFSSSSNRVLVTIERKNYALSVRCLKD